MSGQASAEVVLNQVVGGRRHHRLPTVRDPPQPGCPVHRRAVVVAELEFGLPGVKRRPHPDRPRGRPFDICQTALHLGDGVHCVPRRPKNDKPAVPLAARLDRHPVSGLDGRVDDVVMEAQRLHHDLRSVLPEPGAAFHIREEERDGSLR